MSSVPGGDGSGARDARSSAALMADRDFGPFLLGNFVSNVGTWLHNIAAAIVVFDVTGSAFQVGVLVLAQFGPALVLAPYAGALSDRVDRRRLLMTTQAFAATGGMGLGAWVGTAGIDGLPGVWPVYAASLVIGIGYAFSIPTHQALVAGLVPPTDLDPALALNTVTFTLGRAVGPALGAAVLVASGPALAFFLNGVSYLVFTAALATLHPRRLNHDIGDRAVFTGLRFVLRDRVLVLLLVAVGGMSYAQDPVNTLAPSLADLFDEGDGFVGMLVSAFGLGSVVAALTVGSLRGRHSTHRLGVAGLALLGMGMLGLAAARSGPVALATLVVAGAGFLFAITALTTQVYGRVPEHLRGRVLALWGVAFLGTRPLAGLVDGAIADGLSVRAAVVVAALVAFVAAWSVHRGAERVTPRTRPDVPTRGEDGP